MTVSLLPQAMNYEGVGNMIEDQLDCHQSSYPTLLSLPSEVLISQLSYLTIQDVEQSVKFTCKGFLKLCNAQHLWQEYCQQTGKLDANTSFIASDNEDTDCPHRAYDGIDFKQLYYCTPCVPNDCATVISALLRYPKVKHKLRSKFTITLMPGVYHEQIRLDHLYPSFDNRQGWLHEIHIRAAFHEKGAAIVHYDEHDMNQPCVSITDHDNGNSDNCQQLTVTLQNIQFLHFTRGNDIWNGNCALQVEGRNIKVNVLSCSFQSDSGRGVVVSQGAQLRMSDTNVHDCAATGIYIGDVTSNGFIQRCNILRNGGGTRIPFCAAANESLLLERRGEEQESNQFHLLENIPIEVAEDINIVALEVSNNINIPHHQLVPPGHSGMYFEASTATVNDCLIYRNSLTGLSVVRGGKIKISTCDLLENGSAAFTIEDSHDVMLGLEEGIRGGIEDLGGNSFSADNLRDNYSTFNTSSLVKNERQKMNRHILRKTNYIAQTNNYVTIQNLESFYN